jgi:hypothetical protein
MKRNLFFILFLSVAYSCVNAQNIHEQEELLYLKANGVRINNPEQLNDSVYKLLSPFRVIMFGEMHGTNESAPFVMGLAKLFTGKGENILVGLEIPSSQMTKFNALHTDSSIYQSEFFSHVPPVDGKESFPWASLISSLNKNPKVKIFFFDLNNDDDKALSRDSLMAMKIKEQFNRHPDWKMITLSGNYHNKITNKSSMTSVLKRHIAAEVCALNLEYKDGSAFANFGHGMEIKQLGSYPSVYNSTAGYDQYLLIQSPNVYYEYNGFYYKKTISPAKMTATK